MCSKIPASSPTCSVRPPGLFYHTGPQLRLRDRIFWVLLSRLWSNRRSMLAIVQPETVIKWRRQGFKRYWRWKSRAGKPGRPPIEREIRDLIRRMSRENPMWGAPRIQSELALLGHDIAKATVDKYMIRPQKPPSQTWRTFTKKSRVFSSAIATSSMPAFSTDAATPSSTGEYVTNRSVSFAMDATDLAPADR